MANTHEIAQPKLAQTQTQHPSLDTTFETDTLLQVRTGKIKPFYNLPSPSAIFKTPRQGPVAITLLGCEGDEQAYDLHGGPDKALLHYCAQHYAQWRAEIPQDADRFKVGGFGENLVSDVANERNVCIGDVFRIGGRVEVQVSEPRMPCYKLNHRFRVGDMARRSQDARRTGWYCRVLQPGLLQAGDRIELVRRPHPTWTVANVQHYLHQDMKCKEAMEELVSLPELGHEIKTVFRNRLRNVYRDDASRLDGGPGDQLQTTWREYRIVQKRRETPRIFSFILEALEPGDHDQRVVSGSHVRLKLPGKLVRAYSVVGGTSDRLEIGIALEAQSRGGSRYLHEVASVGNILSASQTQSSFPLSQAADHHILIAGGIGITALIAAARTLQESDRSYELHLAVRSVRDVPFKCYLDELGPNLIINDKSAGRPLDVFKVISKAKINAHIYCCGPSRLVDGVKSAASACGIPPSSIHIEAFQVATSGDPFTAELVSSGRRTVEVDSNQTLLQVLRDIGISVPSSCEAGNCGTCRVNVCSGRVEHRGTGLVESEKAAMMLTCVSRGVGNIVIEV